MSTTETIQAHCLRCHRVLRSAASISRGYGRVCRARIAAAVLTEALADFTDRQIARARDLIADAGLVPTGRPGVYRSASSDGSVSYLSHYAGCTCPAGIHQRPCYHRAAVRILGASRKAA